MAITDYSNINPLPTFFIRNVSVSETKVDISCILRVSPGETYDSIANGTKFSQYVNFYFIAAPKLNTPEISAFYYPQNRIGNLLSLARTENNIDTVSWESVLGPSGQGSEESINPFNLKGYTKTSITEVLQDIEFSQNPLAKHLLNKPATETLDLPFQVTVDLVNKGLDSTLSQLNILAFSQLDLMKIKEDFKLKNFNTIRDIGSVLHYEKCLEREVSGLDVIGDLVPPKVRKAFFRDDGTIYSGETHHHSQANPGPDGYVGWMSGPPGGDMITRERLSVREIPNGKISSSVFMERALNPGGAALTESGFGVSHMDTQELERSEPGNTLLGDSIMETLRTQVGHNVSLVNDTQEKLKQLVTTSLKRGKLNITNTSVSPEDLSWVEASSDTGAHVSLMMLKVGDILAGNSRFGYLLEMHRNITNPDSKKIVSDMASNIKVKNFSVFRRRVTNLPIGNNSVSTGIYNIYDNDEVEELIIRTQMPDTIRSPEIIKSVSTPKAEIIEHNPNVNSLQKTIILRDIDLFHSCDTGKYEYLLDVTLEDGVYNFLNKKKESLTKAIKKYSEYVREASQPYLSPEQSNYYNINQFSNKERDQKERTDAGQIGNYDYDNQKFTDKFIRRSQGLKSHIDNVVDAYVDIYYILTGKTQFTNSRKQDMKSALMAMNSNLPIMERFLDLCLDLESRLHSMVSFSDGGVKGTLNVGSHRRRVSGEVKLPGEMIHLKGSANIIAKAVHKNSLFVETKSLQRGTQNRRNATNNPERSRRNYLGSLSAGTFFSLKVETKTKENKILSVPNRSLSKLFQRVPVASLISSMTEQELASASSAVEAAIEKSKSAPLSRPSDTISSRKLTELDDILSQYGNASFSSLVTKASFTSTSQIDNKSKEKQRFITQSIQDSLLNSIVTTNKASRFVDEVEEKYKDLYFKKQALEELYNIVTSTISTHKMVNSKRKAISFKDRAMNEKSVNTEKQSRKQQSKENRTSINRDVFKPYTIDPQEGLVPAQNSGEFGIIIYKKEGDTFDGAVVVNNVALTNNMARSRSATRPSASPTQPRGGRGAGPMTTQGSSGGGGY